MPPSAAAIGRAARRGSRSSPRTSSRLTSRPMTKKKIAIRPSLIQCFSGWLMPKRPIPIENGVFHTPSQASDQGEIREPERERRAQQQHHTARGFDAQEALERTEQAGRSAGAAGGRARRVPSFQRARFSRCAMREPSTPGMYSISSTIGRRGRGSTPPPRCPVRGSGPRGGVMNTIPRRRRSRVGRAHVSRPGSR